MERYVGLVRSIVYAELLHRDGVDDVVQETLLRAYTQLPRLRLPDRFTPWLARIASTCARGWMRRTMREDAARRMSRADDPVYDPGVPDVDTHEIVERGLASLLDDYRYPLAMRYLSEASYRGIATTLLISEDAARMRVTRALLRPSASRYRKPPVEGAQSRCRSISWTQVATSFVSVSTMTLPNGQSSSS